MNEDLEAIDGLCEKITEQRRRIETLETALEDLVQWSEAYPLDIFPEPNWKRAQTALEAVGITMDAVSASCIRHVMEGVGKIARTALSTRA